MTDTPTPTLSARLQHTAGHLINGTVEDGEVEVAMLFEAADEIDRLNAALVEAKANAEHGWNAAGHAQDQLAAASARIAELEEAMTDPIALADDTRDQDSTLKTALGKD